MSNSITVHMDEVVIKCGVTMHGGGIHRAGGKDVSRERRELK